MDAQAIKLMITKNKQKKSHHLKKKKKKHKHQHHCFYGDVSVWVAPVFFTVPQSHSCISSNRWTEETVLVQNMWSQHHKVWVLWCSNQHHGHWWWWHCLLPLTTEHAPLWAWHGTCPTSFGKRKIDQTKDFISHKGTNVNVEFDSFSCLLFPQSC